MVGKTYICIYKERQYSTRNKFYLVYRYIKIRVTYVTTILKLEKRIFALLIFICGKDTVTRVTRSKISHVWFFLLLLLMPFGQAILRTYLS